MTGAITRREATGVVDPRSGEVVELANAPHSELVDVFLELAKREKAFKDWRTAVEDELVRRHGDRRAAQVVGNHEVDVDRGYGRVWDMDDLLPTLQHLVAEGHLESHVAHSLYRVKTEQVANGRELASLLNRLDGDALAELRRCFRWEQRGRAKVRVTPVVEL